eukprot:TRINITY_DN72816_c0_g1_i1.p1 TRINITY_DN72816_c0_g1~~TRINITY_DN72816_c0_g1_i1.p1  ORF type:complete len:258 (-),score=42.52 TRINITY_DN72816_c0_g1_i1:253-1026(-)
MPRSRVVVFGGAGFVGSTVCRHAIARGAEVYSITRKGACPPAFRNAAWAKKVHWVQGDALEPSTYEHRLQNAEAVVISVGSPPVPWADPRAAYRANGETNIRIIEAAQRVGVPNLVLMNASLPPGADRFISGYARGKRDAAAAALSPQKYDGRAFVLKPSFIVGTRWASLPFGLLPSVPIPIPLQLLFSPYELLWLLGLRKLLEYLPMYLSQVLLPPVDVNDIARVATSYSLLKESEVFGPHSLRLQGRVLKVSSAI